MSEFVDTVLVRLSAPAALSVALTPLERLGVLIDAVYGAEHQRVDHIAAVSVASVGLARPLFPVHRRTGTWTGSVPAYTRTETTTETVTTTDAAWVDLLARVTLQVVVEIDTGEVASISTNEIAGFATLEEFRSRFHYLDLDAFMAAHHLTTVEDLRDAHTYLLADIRLRAPPVFDPDDPANRRDVPVDVAVLVRGEIDLAAALRDAALVRARAHDTHTPSTPTALGTPQEPFAVAVVFPTPGASPSTADIQELFAREGVLALFADPP